MLSPNWCICHFLCIIVALLLNRSTPRGGFPLNNSIEIITSFIGSFYLRRTGKFLMSDQQAMEWLYIKYVQMNYIEGGKKRQCSSVSISVVDGTRTETEDQKKRM